MFPPISASRVVVLSRVGVSAPDRPSGNRLMLYYLPSCKSWTSNQAGGLPQGGFYGQPVVQHEFRATPGRPPPGSLLPGRGDLQEISYAVKELSGGVVYNDWDREKIVQELHHSIPDDSKKNCTI